MKQESRKGAMHPFLVVALMMHLPLVASSSKSPYITVPALGRISHFGYLYNEQTGELRSSSVFRTSNFPSTSIVTTELHSTSTEAEVTNTFAEKLQLLNIDANTGANILSGLVKVRGSARILKDQQTYDEERTGTGILLYHHQTVDQDLQMFSDALKELYNKDLLNHKEATHFVSGITWGLNAAVTFKGIATQHKSRTDVRHELEETFDALRESSLEVDDSRSNFSIFVYSDIALPISEKPRTLRELQSIRNQISEAISNTNGGKGIPVQYKLTPISAIRHYLDVPDRYNVFARHISDTTLDKFPPILDEISSAEQQLRNVREKLDSNLICVHQDTRDKITELNSNFTEFKNTFQKLFQTTLQSVRVGNSSSSELQDLAKSFRLSSFVGLRMRRTLNEFKNALEKINVCNILKHLNPEIEYFGAVDDLRPKIIQNRDKTIFAFFYKSNFIQNDAAAFDQRLNIFLGFMSRPNSKLFVVDCDFDFGLCESVSNTTIRQFVNGVITSPDFVQETEVQETKFEEQIRQLNAKYEAVQKIIITTADEFKKNQSKLEEQITQVTSTINSISARFVDSDDFKAHQQLINTTVTEIQNNLKDSNTHQKITNSTVLVFEDTLEGFNATVQELQKHLGNFTAQQRNVITNVGEIQNNVENIIAAHNYLNTTTIAFQKHQENTLQERFTQVTSKINSLTAVLVDSDHFNVHQQFINTTFEDIQFNLKNIYAHYKIVNTSVEVLQENLENLTAAQNYINATANEFRKSQESKMQEHVTQVTSKINSLTPIFVDSDRFSVHQQFINTTFEDIQYNLRDITAHNKVVNISVEVLQENLGGITTTVEEFRENLEILATQDAALNSTCEANRREIQNLNNELNTINGNCNPNKCKNGGTCSIGFKSFTCHCPPSYTGTTCQTDVNECLQTPNLCQNGGTCRNSNGRYSCDCPLGTTGFHCETNFDDCLNVPCLNGGTCRDRVGDFFCECLPEFEGKTCSQRSSLQCRRLLSSSRMSVYKQNSRLITLNRSGLISLPPQGSSILLEYKSNETYNNNERCLWTLNSLHRNGGRKYWGMQLKVTMLCDGFGNSRDVLSLHALTNKENGNYFSAEFSSHHLQGKKSVEMMLSGSYLSFTSDQSTTGYGFVVEIEVVRLDAGRSDYLYTGQNYFYLSSQGTFTHGPYAANEQVSIGFNSFASTTLIVNYADIENHGDCIFDALNIFEIKENGVLLKKGRLCGRDETLPLTFTTADPILAVFTSDASGQGRGFKLTWK